MNFSKYLSCLSAKFFKLFVFLTLIVACIYSPVKLYNMLYWGRRGRMIVGFTTTCTISVEFESRSLGGVLDKHLRQVGGFLLVLRFPPSINWPPRPTWNIVENGVKHNKPHPPESVASYCHVGYIITVTLFCGVWYTGTVAWYCCVYDIQ